MVRDIQISKEGSIMAFWRVKKTVKILDKSKKKKGVERLGRRREKVWLLP